MCLEVGSAVSPRQPPGSRTPLRWGILGAARIVRRFVPGVRSGTESEVLAIASRSPARAHALAGELGIPRVHSCYEGVLQDPAVDAVYVPLPNSLHPEWTIRAARAGKHVLCEKPLARRAADAERMADACAAAGLVLMEAFMYRHHPQYARAKALLADGAIGAPKLVRASRGFFMSADWRAGGNLRVRPELDGGCLMDLGCYALNVARFLLGAEPIQVAALQVIDPALGVDLAFSAVLHFPEDRLAVIDCSFDLAASQRCEVAGTEGTLLLERPFNPEYEPARIVVERGAERQVVEVPPANHFGCQADHFARSVRAGRLRPPAEDGTTQARAIEALYRSAEAGSAVRLI